MNSPLALTHQVASEMAAYFRGKPDKAVVEAENAIAKDANDPAGHLAMANALIKAGKPKEAITSMRRAMRLDPQYPASYLTRLGRAQFDLGQYTEAAASFESATLRNLEDDRAFMYLAAAYGHLGRFEDARSAVNNTNTLRLETGWSELNRGDISYWKWVSNRKNLLDGLEKSGVEYGHDWYARITVNEGFGSRIEIEGATSVNVEMAKQLFDSGTLFIDIGRGFSREHIPGAQPLNWPLFDNGWWLPREFNKVRLIKLVKKTQPLVVYSSEDLKYTSPLAQATAYAVGSGFEKVYYFNEFDAWKVAGYPVEKGK